MCRDNKKNGQVLVCQSLLPRLPTSGYGNHELPGDPIATGV